jgi:hypothetical protein
MGAGMAQRHGGGAGAGGMRGGGGMGGGFRGGGGMMGGGMMGGGFRGGSFGGFRGNGFVGSRGFGFNKGFRFNNGFFRNRGFGFRGAVFTGFWPWGYSYWPSYPYYDWGYGYDPYDSPSYSYPIANYGYDNSYAYQPAYQPAQQAPTNVTVVVPQQAASPMIREYDQYGQEMRRGGGDYSGGGAVASGGSPVYLIAFKDHTIHAIAAYWITTNTLHYVTLEHQEHTVSMDQVDRPMSEQLNRERRVQFSLTVR